MVGQAEQRGMRWECGAGFRARVWGEGVVHWANALSPLPAPAPTPPPPFRPSRRVSYRPVEIEEGGEGRGRGMGKRERERAGHAIRERGVGGKGGVPGERVPHGRC